MRLNSIPPRLIAVGLLAGLAWALPAKQAYETSPMKEVFHGAEGKRDLNAAVERTEQERAGLVAAVRAAFVPVTHTLRIERVN